MTPISPPRLVSTTASVRNCPSIAPFPAPIAFLSPISEVRSVTDTSMMFITPIPPTKSEMPAIHISIILVDADNCCNSFACSSKSCAAYLMVSSLVDIYPFKISAAPFPTVVIVLVSDALTIRFSGSSN